MASIVKAIKAKDVKWGAVAREINKGVEQSGEILLKAHEDVTKTWDTAVSFKLKTTKVRGWPFRPREIVISVTTGDKRWLWTDKGTKAHIIRPKKRGGVLAFPSSFSPKSKPGSLRARKGSSGGPTVFSREVRHPGTKPRKFTEQIEKKYGPKVRQAINLGFERAAQVSGHGAR